MKANSILIIILFLVSILLLNTNTFSQEQIELLPIEEGNLWGFVNKNGEVVIKPKFISVDVFSEGLAGVQLNEIGKTYGSENEGISTFKNAFINEIGEVVLNVPYDEI